MSQTDDWWDETLRAARAQGRSEASEAAGRRRRLSGDGSRERHRDVRAPNAGCVLCASSESTGARGARESILHRVWSARAGEIRVVLFVRRQSSAAARRRLPRRPQRDVRPRRRGDSQSALPRRTDSSSTDSRRRSVVQCVKTFPRSTFVVFSGQLSKIPRSVLSAPRTRPVRAAPSRAEVPSRRRSRTTIARSNRASNHGDARERRQSTVIGRFADVVPRG